MASRLSTEEENVSSTRDNFLGGDLHGNHGMCCFLVSLSTDNRNYISSIAKYGLNSVKMSPLTFRKLSRQKLNKCQHTLTLAASGMKLS